MQKRLPAAFAKKGCLQPLKKRLWQTACEKTNIWKTKGCAIYPLMAGICSQQPLEKMIYGTVFGKKTSSFKTGSQSQNLWQKGTCMLLQQVEPLKKGMARHQSAKNCSADLVWQSFSVSKPQSLHIPSQAKSSCCHSACPPHCHLK